MDYIIELLQQKVMSEPLQSADAIIWLHGNRFDRCPRALELYEQKYAPRIVLSGNNVLIGVGPKPGQNEPPLTEARQWFVDHGVPEADIVVDDKSMNTRDQAVNVLAMAEREGWQSITLVGSTDHQLRAFLTFLKRQQEIDWNGRIFNQPAKLPLNFIPGGRSQIVGEILDSEIAKLTKYKDHVASPQAGFKYLGTPISIRAATETDADILFVWRNNPETYRYFFSPEPVVWEKHIEWLNKVLADPNRTLYLLHDHDVPVAQVRFDIKEMEAEISLTIAPELRGCGYALPVIQAGVKEFVKSHKNADTIIARIKAENVASIRVFERAGFVRANNDDDKVLTFMFSHL